MSFIPVGRATVFGPNGAVSWTGIAAASEQLVQSMTNRQSANITEVKIGGKVVAAAADETMEEVTLVVVPVAGDGEGENTLANAKAAIVRPAMLSKVTITSDIDIFDGDFNYTGGDVAMAEGNVQHTMNLKRWNGAALDPVT